MFLWIVCIILGILTVSFAPALIGAMVRILSGFGRRFPAIADVMAIITSIIVGAILIAMSAVFAAVYHHMFTGTP